MKHSCAQKKKKEPFTGYRFLKNWNCLKSHPVVPLWEHLLSVWLRLLDKNVTAALFKRPNLQIMETSIFSRNGWMECSALTEKNKRWWTKVVYMCFIYIYQMQYHLLLYPSYTRCPNRSNGFMESEVRFIGECFSFIGGMLMIGGGRGTPLLLSLWMLAIQEVRSDISLSCPPYDPSMSRYTRSGSSLLF